MTRRFSPRDRLGGLDSTQDEPGDEYEFILETETAKAWAVLGRGLVTVWLPKSACSRVAISGRQITLWIPDWLAESKGLA